MKLWKWLFVIAGTITIWEAFKWLDSGSARHDIRHVGIPWRKYKSW